MLAAPITVNNNTTPTPVFTTCNSVATFNRSPSIAKLGEALAIAQGAMKGALKDAQNPFFKSNYADLASVWDACREQLAKNGLAVVQTPTADGAKVSVNTTLIHKTGEWISDTLTMTAKENTPQGIGSTITYARRYALSAFVGIAPEDDDGNAASGKNPADRLRLSPHDGKQYDANGRNQTDRDEMNALYDELKEYDPNGAAATAKKIKSAIGTDYAKGITLMKLAIREIMESRQLDPQDQAASVTGPNKT